MVGRRTFVLAGAAWAWSSAPLSAASTFDAVWRNWAGHPAPSAEVWAGLTRGAVLSGTPLSLLCAVVWEESRFNPRAANPMSTARGLFQFIESTWLISLNAYRSLLPGDLIRLLLRAEGEGRRAVMDLRFDPIFSSVVAGFAIRHWAHEVSARLERVLVHPEWWIPHFLGPEGAYRFLAQVRSAPWNDVRDILSFALRANGRRFPAFLSSGPLSSLMAYTALVQPVAYRMELYERVIARLSRG